MNKNILETCIIRAWMTEWLIANVWNKSANTQTHARSPLKGASLKTKSS